MDGAAIAVAVTITNTDDVISGYTLRCLGVDPAWVRMDHPEPTLFPGETTTVTVTIDLPAELPAGERRVAVQVRELTGLQRTTVEELVIDVAGAPRVDLRLEPSIATGGRWAVFGVTVENNGNTTVDGAVVGSDPEHAITFTFEPPGVPPEPGRAGLRRAAYQRRRGGSRGLPSRGPSSCASRSTRPRPWSPPRGAT